jgi:hypothetical protein
MLAGIITLMSLQAQAAGPLDVFRWKSRLLVVSAARSDDPKLKAQVGLIERANAQVRERDLILITIVGDTVTAPAGLKDAAGILAAAGLSRGGFQVVLIGKDGHRVFRREDPVQPGELATLIDAMPMRQDEMSKAKPG